MLKPVGPAAVAAAVSHLVRLRLGGLDIKNLAVRECRFGYRSQRDAYLALMFYIFIRTHVARYLDGLRSGIFVLDHRLGCSGVEREAVVYIDVPSSARGGGGGDIDGHELVTFMVLGFHLVTPCSVVLYVSVIIIVIPPVVAPVVTVQTQCEFIARGDIDGPFALMHALQVIGAVLMVERV